MSLKLTWMIAVTILSFSSVSFVARAQPFDEPATVNQPLPQMSGDPFFGDYEGTYTPSEMGPNVGGPAPVPATAQVVAQGHDRFKVMLQAKPRDPAGLPLQIELDGQIKGNKLVVAGYAGGHDWDGNIAKQKLHIEKHGYGGFFQMEQVFKKSPTQGLKPPAGAIVLLADVSGEKPSLDKWQDSGWVATEQGIMHKNLGEAGKPWPQNHDISTKQNFTNVHLHVEFRIPYEPDLREQARGNSGVILADRYEVQVLDSFGLVEGAGDCASIYAVAPPKINAAFPPLSWQTYDITFHAPKMNEAGKMTQPARFTVEWNGIKVHEGQTTPTPTGAPDRANAGFGPLRIQDHGNLVFYRNIWIEELPDSEP